MNREELRKEFTQWLTTMESVVAKKNADYAGDRDVFYNFTRIEEMGVATTEQGMMTRMTDKMSRLANYVRVGKLQVEDEGPEDTLLDVSIYAALMAIYLRDKKRQAEKLPVEGDRG